MSDSEVLIRVEHVSKKFCRSLKHSLWYGVCDIAKELNPVGRRVESEKQKAESKSTSASPSAISDFNSQLSALPRLRPAEFWALNDVSFELRRGESLGLIGRNGAGKTTLLRMLNGLIKPDAGRIEMRGRVGALIALGAGFNPILSGRENIYVNGSVLGMTKREIDAKLDEIIDFAELGEFIDAPVRTYSSGMQVRLGFSVATTIQPDLLLIDEVLAVGDVRFRMRCYERVLSLLSRGASAILVSHNMLDISRVCTSGIHLESGAVCHLGEISNAIFSYERQLLRTGAYSMSASSTIRFSPVIQENGSQAGKISLRTSEPLDLAFDVVSPIDIPNCRMLFHLDSPKIGRLCSISTKHFGLHIDLAAGRTHVSISIPRLPLLQGVYQFYFDVYGSSVEDYLGVSGPHELIVSGPPTDPYGFGIYHTLDLDLKWTIGRPALVPASGTL